MCGTGYRKERLVRFALTNGKTTRHGWGAQVSTQALHSARKTQIWWRSNGVQSSTAESGGAWVETRKARRKRILCALKTVFHVSLFTVKLSHILTNLQGISKHKFSHELAAFCHINTDAITLTRTPTQQAQAKDERHGGVQMLYLVR